MSLRPGQHVVVINRWQERYAQYERYIDHDVHRVSYVTTRTGASAIPANRAAVEYVERTADVDAVRDAVKRLAHLTGPISGIVALKEDDLLVGAALREEWGCPGPSTQDLLPFRDKLTMCQRVRADGIDVPEFAEAVTLDDVAAFGASHGWPVIVKPLSRSASDGVVRLDDPSALRVLKAETGSDLGGESMLVQRFDPRPIYHVDGFFDGASVTTCRASRYMTDCLGFRSGQFLASVEDDRDAVQQLIRRFATRALAALTSRATVFHLEVFVDVEQGTCAFLEVGARVGGAEVAFIWRELHECDLMAAAFALQLGLDAGRPRGKFEDGDPVVGGWLLVPAPASRPCQVTRVSHVRDAGEGGPYARVVLRSGQVLPAAESYYEHVGGRFRFRGTTSKQVAEAIVETDQLFSIEASPVAGRPRSTCTW